MAQSVTPVACKLESVKYIFQIDHSYGLQVQRSICGASGLFWPQSKLHQQAPRGIILIMCSSHGQCSHRTTSRTTGKSRTPKHQRCQLTNCWVHCQVQMSLYQEYHNVLLEIFLAPECSFVAALNKILNMWVSSTMLRGIEWHSLQFDDIVHRDWMSSSSIILCSTVSQQAKALPFLVCGARKSTRTSRACPQARSTYGHRIHGT